MFSIHLVLILTSAACVVADSSLARCECKPEVIAAMRKVWAQSWNGKLSEEAAFRLDRGDEPGMVEVVPARRTTEDFRLTLDFDPERTLAIVHVHPQRVEPWPSEADQNLGNKRRGLDPYYLPRGVVSVQL